MFDRAFSNAWMLLFFILDFTLSEDGNSYSDEGQPSSSYISEYIVFNVHLIMTTLILFGIRWYSPHKATLSELQIDPNKVHKNI